MNLTKKIKEKLKRSKSFINIYGKLPISLIGKRSLVAITMEISSACNLHCPFCHVGNGKIEPHFMSLEDHNKIIDLLPKSIKMIRYAYRGDPTLNPKMTEMIKYSHDKGFKTMISTNGMLIEPHIEGLLKSGLDRIIFAVDGADQKTQEKYRIGSDLEIIKGNIKKLAEARKNKKAEFPKEIMVQTVVSRHNEKQVEALTKMAEELGADKIKFKTMAVNLGGSYLMDREKQAEFLPENKNYWRKGQDILLCPALGETVILYNGDVSICCNDYYGSYVMSNLLKEKDFQKAVDNEKYNRMRRSILKKSLPICRDCPITGDYWISEISRFFDNK